MTNGQRIDVYENVTNSILSKLAEGKIPWRKGWRNKLSGDSFSNIPCNAVTNRRYNGINVLLLWAANGYTTSRWLTFRQAKEAGGSVRRGEHGTHIIFYKRITVKDRDSEDGRKEILMARQYTVFNVAQCDNLPDKVVNGPERPAPIEPPDNIDGRIDACEKFIQETGACVIEQGNKACYFPALDSIHVPTFGQFVGATEYYSTLFHELTHWSGARSRLNRDLNGRFGSEKYAAEELIAELGASFLCAEYGLDNSVDNHAAYIQSWINLLKHDKRAIITAASAAQKAVDFLHHKTHDNNDTMREAA